MEAISTGCVASFFSYRILPVLASTAIACLAAILKSWAATVDAAPITDRLKRVKMTFFIVSLF